ncbi:MAG: VOC family protein [Myxococcota bacterium]
MATVTLNDQITLSFSVSDRTKSTRWYVDHFGFKVTMTNDDMGWTELETNTPGVVLGLADAAEPSPGNCVPVFGVADLSASRAALEAHKVRFDGETIVVEGMVKLATLYDPDDNALMLAEDLTEAAAS